MSDCNRDHHLALKAQNIRYLTLYRKSWPTPGLRRSGSDGETLRYILEGEPIAFISRLDRRKGRDGMQVPGFWLENLVDSDAMY